MADFLTGEQLDSKLTDIIWNAKQELIIVSPFIWLDDYCKEIFKRLNNKPEVEIIIVFGKNEGEAQRSLKPQDLEIFKQFTNITIIYCKDLHAKYYANESEALLTSLNLLGKSMTGNIEYGINIQKSALNSKLYDDSNQYTHDLIIKYPCIFVKRPMYRKTMFGLSKKYIESVVLADYTEALYKNMSFDRKFYKAFEKEMFEDDTKPSREDLITEPKKQEYRSNYRNQEIQQEGFCIRTGVSIPFDPNKPFSYTAYQSWAYFGNYDFPEKYCHKTGKLSNGKTSMANPIL